ncbi:lipid-A-disaccharide synthase-related protein [Moorena sp. SIO4G3]|uniref:lipid-A-disaccharide synthase-related protein n=1 Tax=Moorena sp. SIO4G3 TaxID=2607821 RepID=UPI00142B4D4A|nr:lipid-A-disaccharide synthase-related protein [Moorena sp. SIO4G3]NEO80261.1 hypothetical protein [Moorena sp. SIO4G3]
MRLLCLSNGHGEDVIAVQILQELQHYSTCPELAALPLVGEGKAYVPLDIPIIGSVEQMPSGGFIYMSQQQVWRDVQGGLVQLILSQLKAIRRWAKLGDFILAVGDIVPLLFAWWSGLPYGFVGTAKSEYYLRDESGWLPNRPRWEGWSGSVYLPWERWLMSNRRCNGVFPRDTLTTQILKQWSIPAFDLGNPMMDGIYPDYPAPMVYDKDAELNETKRTLTITLLPGSRIPEAYHNWHQIILAASGLLDTFASRSLLFLAAIAPGLSQDPLREVLVAHSWSEVTLPSHPFNFQLQDKQALAFTKQNGTLILTQNDYNLCLLQGDFCIAMAGTATEQFVGLGKPAIAMPGVGPQYTPAFAEAQTRLLGPSLVIAQQPEFVASIAKELFQNPDKLQLIAENGQRRLGQPGAAARIAKCLIEKMNDKL